MAGEAGVARAVTLLGEELERNMALLGVTSISSVGPQCLRRRH
ncbi:alpha-hydroxy-acid oxidizing protein [Halomonas sp.]